MDIWDRHLPAAEWGKVACGHTKGTTDSSWAGGTAPSNSAVADTATFTSVPNAQPQLNVTGNRSLNGIDFQLPADGLTSFTSDPGATFRLGATGIVATTRFSRVHSAASHPVATVPQSPVADPPQIRTLQRGYFTSLTSTLPPLGRTTASRIFAKERPSVVACMKSF